MKVDEPDQLVADDETEKCFACIYRCFDITVKFSPLTEPPNITFSIPGFSKPKPWSWERLTILSKMRVVHLLPVSSSGLSGSLKHVELARTCHQRGGRVEAGDVGEAEGEQRRLLRIWMRVQRWKTCLTNLFRNQPVDKPEPEPPQSRKPKRPQSQRPKQPQSPRRLKRPQSPRIPLPASLQPRNLKGPNLLRPPKPNRNESAEQPMTQPMTLKPQSQSVPSVEQNLQLWLSTLSPWRKGRS